MRQVLVRHAGILPGVCEHAAAAASLQLPEDLQVSQQSCTSNLPAQPRSTSHFTADKVSSGVGVVELRVDKLSNGKAAD